MKSSLLLSLLFLSSSIFAAAEWKVIAETTNCADTTQILAKEGEKFVKALSRGKEQKLFAQNGAIYQANSPKTTFFKAQAEGLTDSTLSFTKPGVVESNTPKLDVVADGKKSHCNMKSK